MNSDTSGVTATTGLRLKSFRGTWSLSLALEEVEGLEGLEENREG